MGGEQLLGVAKLAGALAVLAGCFYLVRYIVRRRVERKQWVGVPVPRAWFPDDAESEKGMTGRFVIVARDLGQHRRRPGNPASCIKRRAGGWFRWARRDTLRDALVTRTGLGIGYETRIFIRGTP